MGKEKRRLTNDNIEAELETEAANNYVHIALNNEFQTWKEGSDFINALAWELGLPEHALTDRTIEKNHVQFKVEPNDQSVDAPRIAEALNEIGIEKRLDDKKRSMAPAPLGVDIASVAAGGKDDRASATASLIVGGLIFALASRRRGVAKKCEQTSA